MLIQRYADSEIQDTFAIRAAVGWWWCRASYYYKYVRSSTEMAKKALPLMTTPSYLQPHFCQCLHAWIWQGRKNMQMKKQKKKEKMKKGASPLIFRSQLSRHSRHMARRRRREEGGPDWLPVAK